MKPTSQPMKLCLHVTRSTSTAARGNVDVDLAPELAVAIFREHLDLIARPFVSAGGAPAHRLVTSTPDAVLALRWLRTELQAAQRWSALVLAQVHTFRPDAIDRDVTAVPDHVDAIWNRYPVPVYRDLLGPDVEAALAEVGRRAVAVAWNTGMRDILAAESPRDAFAAARLVMPEDDPTATDAKRTWVPVTRYCDPRLVAIAHDLSQQIPRKA